MVAAWWLLAVGCIRLPDGDVESREVYAEALDTTYTVTVYVPEEAEGISGVPWVLVLDGGVLLTEGRISEDHIRAGRAAPHVVVGIDNAATRERDYTPTNSGTSEVPIGGGLDPFVGWLETDFIPSMEAELDIGGDPSVRALHGHSYGGIATVASMFRHQRIWTRFGATSPSLWWDDGVIFAEEEVWADTHDDLPVRLYMSMGQLEVPGMNPLFDEMVERVDERAYPGLDFEHEVLRGHEHYSGWEPGYEGLIPHLFPRNTP